MKRLLCRLLACLTLCAALAGTIPQSASAVFQDVPQNHWAAESIRQCAELGFFKGESETRFGLGQQMTRSAFTVVLCRFFGWDTTASGKTLYSDVPANAWYAGAIEAAYAHGAITDQRADFRPADPITREELAVMLVRALGYGSLSGLNQDLPAPFQDVTTNPGYISMAYYLGLVSGTSADTFSPERHATREQVAVILMRLHNKLHKDASAPLVIASTPEAMEGASVAAIPALRLVSSNLVTTMLPEESSAAMDAARQAEIPALLHVLGSSLALNDVNQTAEGLIAAVQDGGYDGLFLDLPTLPTQSRQPLVKLAKKLHAALGDKLFYLTAEAPVRSGKSYGGYIYDTLAANTDYLVLRVPPYTNTSSGVAVTVPAPPEEIYYAMVSLSGTVDPARTVLTFSSAPMVYQGKKPYDLPAEELELLLADESHVHNSSQRYGARYFTAKTPTDKQISIWYLDEAGISARLRMASLLGFAQVCITE